MWMDYYCLVLIGIITSTNVDCVRVSSPNFSEWDFKTCSKRINGALRLCTDASTCVLKSNFYSVKTTNVLYLDISLRCESGNCTGELLRLTIAESNNHFNISNMYTKNGKTTEKIKLSNYKNDIHLIFDVNKNLTPSKCFTIVDIVLYYFTCDVTNSRLLQLPNIAAPYHETSGRINATCVKNAVLKANSTLPHMTCFQNGTTYIFGECECVAGYERNKQTCAECDALYYKPVDGNSDCVRCGHNSRSTPNSRTKCVCDAGYYHLSTEKNDSSSPCHAPPSAPIYVNESVTSSEATIYWKMLDNGSDPFGIFSISCLECPIKNFNTTESMTTIKGLSPFSKYILSIVKINNITLLTGKKFTTTVTITTNTAALGKIQNVRTVTNSDKAIIISWTAPFARGAQSIQYRITYDEKTYKTETTKFKIPASYEKKSYTVEIIVVAVYKDGIFTSKESYRLTVNVDGKGKPLGIVLGATGGALVLFILIIGVVVLIWKYNRASHLQVYRMEDGTVQLQRSRLFSHGRIYVDPTTYSLVDDAVYEFTAELNHKFLTMGNLLGCGEFADVYHAVLVKSVKEIDVAVKKLKYGASKRDRDDFVSEAAILGQFSHANVISLEGVILKDHPNVIVLEYMAHGALDKYLQRNENQFSVVTLLGMARGIASGMTYLSDLGYIHRDLAARNVLVNKQDVCKVADFGMSRELKTDETYDTRGGKIPIKWTAPESIEFKKFTTASDVWSFGIVLWEIFSFGERPYWIWTNYEVLERLATGYRLPPPSNCPKVVHDLMLQCWHKDRTKRPKFLTMREYIEEWIRIPELLKDIASVITKSDENLDYSLMQNVTSWLEAIKMEQYAPIFANKGFSTPKDMLDLKMEDLIELGIGPVGHRKKILKAVKNTRSQVEGRKVGRSTSNIGAMLSRNTSSVSANAALSKKLSLYRKKNSSVSGKTTLDRREKKTSLSCM